MRVRILIGGIGLSGVLHVFLTQMILSIMLRLGYTKWHL